MRVLSALGMALIALASVPGQAQISFRSADDMEGDPYVACQAWFGMEGTIYAAEDAPNDPKVSSRFRYYAEKFAREQGHDRVNTDCISFTRKAPSWAQSHTPGHSYYNSLWKKQVTVVRFPGLPEGWSKTPVPGEEVERKEEEKDPEPGDLQTITYLYPKGTPSDPGYEFASIDVKYRFIACMGEVHAAYSLDPESVRTSDYYVSRNGSVPVGDVAPPKPTTIEMTAVAKPRLNSKHLGSIVLQDRYGRVSDGFAAPALGYGCFTGQSQKVGMVAEIVRGKHEPRALDAILNDALVLDYQFIGMAHLKNPLRNGSLDDAMTDLQKAEEERLALERAEAEAARLAAEAADRKYPRRDLRRRDRTDQGHRRRERGRARVRGRSPSTLRARNGRQAGGGREVRERHGRARSRAGAPRRRTRRVRAQDGGISPGHRQRRQAGGMTPNARARSAPRAPSG